MLQTPIWLPGKKNLLWYWLELDSHYQTFLSCQTVKVPCSEKKSDSWMWRYLVFPPLATVLRLSKLPIRSFYWIRFWLYSPHTKSWRGPSRGCIVCRWGDWCGRYFWEGYRKYYWCFISKSPLDNDSMNPFYLLLFQAVFKKFARIQTSINCELSRLNEKWKRKIPVRN